MGRGANRTRYSLRTRMLTLVAGIALVASVPFHYSTQMAAIAIALLIALAAVISAFLDARRSRA
jgi:peptidoglycan/LPS O-acetylase OafA/YrhL